MSSKEKNMAAIKCKVHNPIKVAEKPKPKVVKPKKEKEDGKE
jgi:hypothetical protein